MKLQDKYAELDIEMRKGKIDNYWSKVLNDLVDTKV
jgi:hypothetical protein